MIKILKIKDYLTIDESLQYLAAELKEDVSLEQLAYLVDEFDALVSVKFNRRVFVKKGSIVSFSTGEYCELAKDKNKVELWGGFIPSEFGTDKITGKYYGLKLGIQEIQSNEIWDLSPINLESGAIYNFLINGDSSGIHSTDDHVLLCKEDSIARLLKPFPHKQSVEITYLIDPEMNETEESWWNNDINLIASNRKNLSIDSFIGPFGMQEFDEENYPFRNKSRLDDFEYQLLFKREVLDGLVSRIEDKLRPAQEKDSYIHHKRLNSFQATIDGLCKHLSLNNEDFSNQETEDLYLRNIGFLLFRSKIDPGSRTATSTLQTILDTAGENLSTSTIKSILNEICEKNYFRQSF